MALKFIVAIGYSEGGLKPLLTLFDRLPHDQVTYVILRHIPLAQRSQLCEILKKHSKLKIMEAEDGMEIENDIIYIPPSESYMTIKNDKFYLSKRVFDSRKYNFCIDVFLESLAIEKGAKSIAVIMSGSGTDGAVGITKIHEAGGTVIVQDPQSCEYPDMPLRAINAKCVTKVLPPAEMADFIVGIAQPILQNSNFAKRLFH